jgi:hypothetical protein
MKNLCAQALMHYFGGTEVVKPPIYFIGHKMMFGSVSFHFANLVHGKRCETCVQA